MSDDSKEERPKVNTQAPNVFSWKCWRVLTVDRAFEAAHEQPPPGPSRPTRRRHTVVPGEPVVDARPRLADHHGSPMESIPCERGY